MSKWTNCLCNCQIGDYQGVQQTDGKIVRCTNYGKGDCVANKKLSEFKLDMQLKMEKGFVSDDKLLTILQIVLWLIIIIMWSI